MTAKDELKIMLDELELFGYNIRRVAKETSYEAETIKRALRGKITDKLFNKIKALHTMAKEKASNPVNEMNERVKRIEVTQDIILTAIADIMARLTNRSSAIIKAEYEKLKDERAGNG